MKSTLLNPPLLPLILSLLSGVTQNTCHPSVSLIKTEMFLPDPPLSNYLLLSHGKWISRQPLTVSSFRMDLSCKELPHLKPHVSCVNLYLVTEQGQDIKVCHFVYTKAILSHSPNWVTFCCTCIAIWLLSLPNSSFSSLS